MFVGMWMTEDLVTIEPALPLADAAALMARHHIRRLPVVEPTAAGPRLVGIVSATDILRAFPPQVNPFSVVAAETMDTLARRAHHAGVKTADIMQRMPITATADAPIESVARIMRGRKIGALPVVRQEILIGLITESDIFRAFASLFEASQGGARLTFDLTKDEDPLALLVDLTRRHGVRIHSFTSSLHHARPVCVVHVTGEEAGVEAMLEAVWSSHHRVLNVVRMPSTVSDAQPPQ
jgi:acetoin utilization protein AcuB